jgi:hypothetical protein
MDEILEILKSNSAVKVKGIPCISILSDYLRKGLNYQLDDVKIVNFQDLNIDFETFKKTKLAILQGYSSLLFLFYHFWKKYLKKTKIVLCNTDFLFEEAPIYIFPYQKNIETRYLSDYNQLEDEESLKEEVKKKVNDLLQDLNGDNINGDNINENNINENNINGDNINENNINENNINGRILLLLPEEFQDISFQIKEGILFINNSECQKFDIVIDTMIKKQQVVTLTEGITEKFSYTINQTNYNSPIIYKLISEETYNFEILTQNLFSDIPLHQLMILAYKYNLNPAVLFKEFFDPEQLIFYNSMFYQFGILDLNLKLTKKHKFLKQLPFGLRISLLVTESPNEFIYPSIVVASLLNNLNYATTPFIFSDTIRRNNNTEENIASESKLNELEHIKKYFNRFRSNSDIETLLYLYKAYIEESKNISKRQWCEINFINWNYMKNVEKDIKKSCEIMQISPIIYNVEEYIYGIDDIMKKLYKDRKYYLNTNNQLLSVYFLNIGVQTETGNYYLDTKAINNVEEFKPLEIYSIISSYSDESSHTIHINYVSPYTYYQKFN